MEIIPKKEAVLWLAVICASVIALVLILPRFCDTNRRAINATPPADLKFWQIQSIDTMKYSRDLAREKEKDQSFDLVIDGTMEKIAQAGATHVAIGTPYDEEFFPMIERWVKAARKHGLNVWFRGNWSGWEGWFDYPPISPEEHIKKTAAFIGSHPEIFADGDCFTACPECENGTLGDPRKTGDVMPFRKFLVDEQAVLVKSFASAGRRVNTGLASMNGDVARLIMDKNTTAALGGIITIDHYVATPERLKADIDDMLANSDGKIMLGEFGVPIPDIHGNMNPEEQAAWIRKALGSMAGEKRIIGVNYWLSAGGTSALWSDDGSLRPAYYAIKNFYQPQIIQGAVSNELGNPISGAKVSFFGQTTYTGPKGDFYILSGDEKKGRLQVESSGYYGSTANLTDDNDFIGVITLSRKNPGIWFSFMKQLISAGRQGCNYFNGPGSKP